MQSLLFACTFPTILQGPAPNTVLVSEAIIGHDINLRDAKVSFYVRVQQSCNKVRCQAETLDQRLVKGEIAQNIGSATNNLQSAPDAINAIDTFSAIFAPLKVFISIANEVADVLVFISLYL